VGCVLRFFARAGVSLLVVIGFGLASCAPVAPVVKASKRHHKTAARPTSRTVVPPRSGVRNPRRPATVAATRPKGSASGARSVAGAGGQTVDQGGSRSATQAALGASRGVQSFATCVRGCRSASPGPGSRLMCRDTCLCRYQCAAEADAGACVNYWRRSLP